MKTERNQMSKKFRLILAILALSLMIIQLAMLDYSDLSWNNNPGSYLGITSMALLAFVMFSEIRRVNNQELHSEK